jgi:hypothetical protein
LAGSGSDGFRSRANRVHKSKSHHIYRVYIHFLRRFEKSPLPPLCSLPDLSAPGPIAAEAEDLGHHLDPLGTDGLLQELLADVGRQDVDALDLAEDALGLLLLDVAQVAVGAAEAPARLRHFL